MNPQQICPNCPPSAGTKTIFTLASDVRVVRCRGCGLQFAVGYPAIQTADSEVYGEHYFAGAIEQRREREAIFAELMAEIESVLGRKGRLLDVGCGDGALVKTAADLGWLAEGTDVATAAIRFTRERAGVTVHHGVVEALDLEPKSFDVIVLNHVLEHVRDPRATLSHLKVLLRTGGVIRVEVPNLASLSARTQNLQSKFRLKKHRWRHYETGHHFWFFTPRTLAKTIRSAGLEPFRLAAPTEQWGYKSHYTRMLNALYRRTFWGGHLIAYARRGG